MYEIKGLRQYGYAAIFLSFCLSVASCSDNDNDSASPRDDGSDGLLIGSWAADTDEECKLRVDFEEDGTFSNSYGMEIQSGGWELIQVDEIADSVLLVVTTFETNFGENCEGSVQQDLQVIQPLLSFSDENSMVWTFGEAEFPFVREMREQ